MLIERSLLDTHMLDGAAAWYQEQRAMTSVAIVRPGMRTRSDTGGSKAE